MVEISVKVDFVSEVESQKYALVDGVTGNTANDDQGQGNMYVTVSFQLHVNCNR